MPAPGFHYNDSGKGKPLSGRKVRKLARAYGLPARAFSKITRGESNRDPYVQQKDPGDGMVGYGLFQLTPNAWGNGAAKQYFNKLGGVEGMRDLENQFKMARFLYKSAGNSIKPWYGTRYLTDRTGVGSLGPVDHAAFDQVAGDGGGRRQPRYAPASTVTTPGVDNSDTRLQLKQAYLLNRHDPNALLQLALGLRESGDTPAVTTTTPGKRLRAVKPERQTGYGGKVHIAPTADRAGVPTHHNVVEFVKRISSLYGKPLTIGTGSNHSQMTTSGNVSDHWRGEAADIPLTGRALIKAGQDALIAAGMSPKAARKQHGGLFNVPQKSGRRVQIIFNTHIGGDHTDHLHVGF